MSRTKEGRNAQKIIKCRQPDVNQFLPGYQTGQHECHLPSAVAPLTCRNEERQFYETPFLATPLFEGVPFAFLRLPSNCINPYGTEETHQIHDNITSSPDWSPYLFWAQDKHMDQSNHKYTKSRRRRRRKLHSCLRAWGDVDSESGASSDDSLGIRQLKQSEEELISRLDKIDLFPEYKLSRDKTNKHPI